MQSQGSSEISIDLRKALQFPFFNMTAAQDNRQLADSKEAPDFAHVNSVLEDEKPSAVEERDYTGTAKKTDPEEIRLVRKLDLWIMVSGIERLHLIMANI